MLAWIKKALAWTVAIVVILFELIWLFFDSPSDNRFRTVLSRVQEPEVMDSPEEAIEYDAMDHSVVNAKFVADFLQAHGACQTGEILDVGTGTARIPMELCRVDLSAKVLGVDLAPHMLSKARENVSSHGMSDRICLELVDAKGLPFDDGRFEAVISNSIIHHIPDPTTALAEMVRVVAPGGTLMVRDLFRPDRSKDVDKLVETYAADESEKARSLFEASLRAAFRVDEIQKMVLAMNLPIEDVKQTSDRHWTWIWRRPTHESA
jgi:ubiquinone/menaquinone biosynthesis C-methylase UbiE